MMKSSYGQHFLGFYSGWAKDIVSNSNNNNNNKGSTNQILGRKKAIHKRQINHNKLVLMPCNSIAPLKQKSLAV